MPLGASETGDVAYWLVVVQAIFTATSALAAAVSAIAAVYVIRSTIAERRQFDTSATETSFTSS